MEFDNFITHSIDLYMGKPKSGKTLIAGSYPKPLLYISVGNDGGGRVLQRAYPDDCRNGNIKVKNLKNDFPTVVGKSLKINKTSIEKLADILYELRQPGAPQFKTIVIDTVGALQDDYKTALETMKGNKLSQQEWGEVSSMMMNIKENMKRFSEDTGTIFVWCSHTSEQEIYETSGLNKELRIIPDLTIKTGIKYMKDASNIFYCCRKTTIEPGGKRDVKFLTYVGPHPLMDTGTRDLLLEHGAFVENFTYTKWQQMVNAGTLDATKVEVPQEDSDNNKSADEGEGE